MTSAGAVSRQAALRLAGTGDVDELRRLADRGDAQGRRQLAAWCVRNDLVDELRERTAGGDRFAARRWAGLLARQRRWDEALTVLRSLDGERDRMRLARMLAGRGLVDEAVAQAPAELVRAGVVSGWAESQGRVDLLRAAVAAGDPAAAAALRRIALARWRSGRLAAAIELVEDPATEPEHLVERLVAGACGWREGKLPLRDRAIDLLGAVGGPRCRRARAGILLAQGRRAEAIAELRSLADTGDSAAGRSLAAELGRDQPVRELRTLAHTIGGYLSGVAFDPGGNRLATAGSPPTMVLVWDPRTGEHRHTLPESTAAGAVAFSPDGTLVAGGVYNGAWLWDAATGERVGTLRGTPGFGAVAFGADGTLVAGGALWDPATGERLRDLGLRPSVAVAISPDGLIATADRPAWGEIPAVWLHGDPVPGSPAARDAVSGSPAARDAVSGSPAARDAVSGDAAATRDAAAREVESLAGAKQRATSYRGLAFSPDGGLLAVACDEWVSLTDPVTGEQVRRIGDSGADAIAFSPDGSLLATARGAHWSDAAVRLWDPRSGVLVRHIGTGADAVAFDPGGALLATASRSDGVTRLWDVAVHT